MVSREKQTISSKDVGKLEDVLNPPKTGVVEATMAGSAAMKSGAQGKARSNILQAAMTQAIKDAGEKGIVDPAKIKAMMMDYHKRARDAMDQADREHQENQA